MASSYMNDYIYNININIIMHDTARLFIRAFANLHCMYGSYIQVDKRTRIYILACMHARVRETSKLSRISINSPSI